MKKRNLLVCLLTGCVLTASMSVGTAATVHAEAETAATAAVEPGTNMYAAGELTLNAPVSGTSEDLYDYHWYSFTTGAAETEYQITCLNRSGDDVDFNIYDEMGTELYWGEASSNGVPEVITAGDLEADTTYYVRIVSSNNSVDYTLTVKDPTAPASEIVSEGEELVPGDSMYTAGSIPLGEKVSGTSENLYDYHWYSFTTEAEEGVEYQISCVNATPGSSKVLIDIYDANSEVLYSERASSDGKPSTIVASDLQPDTTYYVRVVSKNNAIDYILMVKDPKTDDKKAAPADQAAAAGAAEEQSAPAADTEASTEATAE